MAPRTAIVAGLAFQLLLSTIIAPMYVTAQDTIFITGTGVAQTCGFNLLARLVVSNTCKGCSKTYAASTTWTIRLLYAGGHCGCGTVCSVAGFHLFTLCQESLVGARFTWGRRRRDLTESADFDMGDAIDKLMANKSIPYQVSHEQLAKELQAAQDKLMEMGLAPKLPEPFQNATSVQGVGEQAAPVGGQQPESKTSASDVLYQAIQADAQERVRRASGDLANCVIHWDDIPMNRVCCINSIGCSALQMREFC